MKALKKEFFALTQLIGSRASDADNTSCGTDDTDTAVVSERYSSPVGAAQLYEALFG